MWEQSVQYQKNRPDTPTEVMNRILNDKFIMLGEKTFGLTQVILTIITISVTNILTYFNLRVKRFLGDIYFHLFLSLPNSSHIICA